MLNILKTVKAIIPTVSAVFSKLRVLINPESFIIVPMSLGTVIIVFIFYSPDVKSIPCAIEGMLSPCRVEVGESRAPVPTKSTRLRDFSRKRRIIYEFTTAPLQPQPEPPA